MKATTKAPVNRRGRCPGLMRYKNVWTDACAVSVGENPWGVPADLDVDNFPSIAQQVQAKLADLADADEVVEVNAWRVGGSPRGHLYYEFDTSGGWNAFYSGAYLNPLLQLHKPDALLITPKELLILMVANQPTAALAGAGGRMDTLRQVEVPTSYQRFFLSAIPALTAGEELGT